MGAVEEMMCVLCVGVQRGRGHSGDGRDLVLSLCTRFICSGLGKRAAIESEKYLFRAANVWWWCA